MAEAEIPKQLGDYELIELIEHQDNLLSFDARQNSVGRKVVLVLLHPDAATPEGVQSFKAMVRAKAGVHQVHIGPIFEIQELDGIHFFTRQHVVGQSLAQLADEGKMLAPSLVFKILESAAEAFIYLEENQINTRPLSLRHLYLGPDGVCYLRNTALAGERDDSRSSEDLFKLGSELKALIELNAPGSGRAHTLLQWMRGEGRETEMTWSELLKLCKRVEDQFTSDTVERPASRPLGSKPKSNSWLPFVIGALAVVLAVAVFAVLNTGNPSQNEETPPKAKPPLEILSKENDQPMFSISQSPVSIGEYHEFLLMWDEMNEAARHALRHPEQPAEKKSYEPTDWLDMLSAARSETTWENRTLSLDSPVTYVDFWDAWAYSKAMNGKLPAEDEWLSTIEFCLNRQIASPRLETLREWTSTRQRKPSFPMGPQYPRVLNQLNGGAPTSFVENRSLRSSDLGFRLLFPPEPPSQP